jgi:MOSC domain-containing protein YiiM
MAYEGSVAGIFIAPEQAADMRAVDRVKAIEGKGLEGDRYFTETGTFSDEPGPSREVTLIEIEAIEAVRREAGIEFGLGESRRNVVTRGVPLNHFVDKEFTVGGVRLRGIRLCEPCSYLAKLLDKPVTTLLLHRAGLRARILQGGEIAVNDPIRA